MNVLKPSHLSVFIASTFLLSLLLSLLVHVIGFEDAWLGLVRISAMLIPAIGVLVMIIFKDPPKNVGWTRFPPMWLLPALFLLPLAIHLVALPLVAFLNEMTIPWQPWLVPDAEGIFHAPASRGWGDLTLTQLIKHIVINALVGIIVVSMLAFFEEIGWRVWMLPRLMDRWGQDMGVLLSAVIWALWHLPFVVGGLNVIPEVPIYAMLILYPVGLVGAGIVLGWLWVKTESIWIVCIGHGALNNWGQYAFKFMRDASPNPEGWPWLYTGVNVAMILVGLIVLKMGFGSDNRRSQTADFN